MRLTSAMRPPSSQAAPRPSARRGGFTLIELLAVIVILSILAWFLVTNLGKTQEVAEVKMVEGDMVKLRAMLAEVDNTEGGYPPSRFADALGAPPNATNLGAECLYLALCAEDAPGFGVLDADLINSDGDSLAHTPKGLRTRELFELRDRWDNPIAYFHNQDYGREDVYVTVSNATGLSTETVVKAYKNPKTANWFEPRSFQLISAGADGEFGTEDDITSFKR